MGLSCYQWWRCFILANMVRRSFVKYRHKPWCADKRFLLMTKTTFSEQKKQTKKIISCLSGLWVKQFCVTGLTTVPTTFFSQECKHSKSTSYWEPFFESKFRGCPSFSEVFYLQIVQRSIRTTEISWTPFKKTVTVKGVGQTSKIWTKNWSLHSHQGVWWWKDNILSYQTHCSRQTLAGFKQAESTPWNSNWHFLNFVK